VANSSSLNITGAVTLEAWVKPSSTPFVEQILSRYTSSDGGYDLCLYNGKARMDMLHTGTAYNPLVGNTVLSTNVWHHVAGVFDGSQYRLYVDGVLDASSSTTYAPASGTGGLAIGRDATGAGQYFNGLIDEIRITSGVVYTTNFTPPTHLTAVSGTAGLWKFDGQTLTDSSGNSNNGTLGGNATYSTDIPGGGGTGSTDIEWIVTDHLGTPRMILDHSGSLTGMKRHDYLPFGEEIGVSQGNNQGLRTAAMGYGPMVTGVNDGERQKFTQKERDNETGLDYFGARYFASVQGRFTGVDPENFQARQDPSNPQAWNAYAYVNNDPLRFTDPDGRGIGEIFEKIKNKIVYGYYETNAQIDQRAAEARAYLEAQSEQYNGLFFTYRDGTTVRIEPDKLGKGGLISWANIFKTAIEDNQVRTLTPEEIAAAVSIIGYTPAPGVNVDPYSPESVRKRQQSELKQLRDKMQSIGREAERLGFNQVVKDAPFNSHGQKVFSDGSRYITRDIDSHSGGVWKMFNRAGERLGTFDKDLNYIGK
jgi:RHS repeat-associated protein